MRPPLTRIKVLHLDHPFGKCIPYACLRELLTTPSHLQHLSIGGDIVNDYPPFVSLSAIIPLPSLLSLHLACKDGRLYLGILLNIDAPRLQRVILKDVRNGDLEQRGTPVSFPQVTELVFVNFDFSAESYRCLLPMFPSVEIFRVPWSTVGRLVPKVFQHKVSHVDYPALPWPTLRILHLGFDAEESALPLQDLFELRDRLECPLSRVHFNTNEEGAVQAYLAPVPIGNQVGTQNGLGYWLADVQGQTLDYDDNFFN